MTELTYHLLQGLSWYGAKTYNVKPHVRLGVESSAMCTGGIASWSAGVKMVEVRMAQTKIIIFIV